MSKLTCECCGRFRRDGWSATRAAVVQALEDADGGTPTAANFWRAAAILAAETGVVHLIEWWRSYGFSIDGQPLDAWFADRVMRDAHDANPAAHGHMRDGTPVAVLNEPAPPMTVCPDCGAWSGGIGRFEGCRCRR